MKLKYRSFGIMTYLVDFVNENNIKRENIENIFSGDGMYHMVYWGE